MKDEGKLKGANLRNDNNNSNCAVVDEPQRCHGHFSFFFSGDLLLYFSFIYPFLLHSLLTRYKNLCIGTLSRGAALLFVESSAKSPLFFSTNIKQQTKLISTKSVLFLSFCQLHFR